MKKALVTGIRGQDGAYLADLLLSKGYEVYGADRKEGSNNNGRLDMLGISHNIKYVLIDLLNIDMINKLIKEVQPDEFYNLAAKSFVKASFEQPLSVTDVNALGSVRILEALREHSPHTKFYQASSSEIFGKGQETPQHENTSCDPQTPYGAAKLLAHIMTKNYRKTYDMYACSGILYNHESPLRGLEFVTRKITNGVARIAKGLQDKITLGNIDAQRDWGYAKEYVEGMWLMLQQEKADDYVLATGKQHTVREFIEYAFKIAGIDIRWEGEGVDEKGINKANNKVVVEISAEFYRPAEVSSLVGDPRKAEKILGRKAQTNLEGLTKLMVEHDLNILD